MDPSYRFDERDQRQERDATRTEAHKALDDARVPRQILGRPLDILERINYLARNYQALQAAYKELVGQHNALIAENMGLAKLMRGSK